MLPLFTRPRGLVSAVVMEEVGVERRDSKESRKKRKIGKIGERRKAIVGYTITENGKVQRFG